MTSYERDRFASLPACDECDHPEGHHTAARGCWHCDCRERPGFVAESRGRITTTDAAGIYATPDGYLVTPDALRRMGVRPGAVAAVVQRCHDAAGLPPLAIVLREVAG